MDRRCRPVGVVGCDGAADGRGLDELRPGAHYRDNLDLQYFVEWRPYLWQRPVARALRYLGDLQGKRVLEIGGRSGRMSCLMAMLGAEVTMLQKGPVQHADTEAAKWQVGDRVRNISADGGLEAIAGETFDAIFTKSVLWCIPDLADFLDQLEVHLAEDGKVAFVENCLGGPCLRWKYSGTWPISTNTSASRRSTICC